MERRAIFEFLEELQLNNSKEWMDANRKWYKQTKKIIFNTFDPILERSKTEIRGL